MKTIAISLACLLVAATAASAGLAPNGVDLTGSANGAPVAVLGLELPAAR
ncbi:MAG TPA: hypothetical protein VMP03_05160 [Methylomirabilota bacterium]|nr:hypothetical protein [Methylomirabilota bacterium]